MNTTTNYNFNVPVGSDLVNPLVQDFPNWTNLDSILKSVSETGVSTATHTKAGTVHAILLSDSDIPMFRFEASAVFHTNDTFTVDGVAVSAVTVAGAGLPDEAFVIGSMVLCELNSNVMTVYGVGGSDADTLEGHSASYFATASDLQTVDDKADANKILIDDINDNITAIYVGTATSSSTGNIDVSNYIPSNMLLIGASSTTNNSSFTVGGNTYVRPTARDSNDNKLVQLPNTTVDNLYIYCIKLPS